MADTTQQNSTETQAGSPATGKTATKGKPEPVKFSALATGAAPAETQTQKTPNASSTDTSQQNQTSTSQGTQQGQQASPDAGTQGSQGQQAQAASTAQQGQEGSQQGSQTQPAATTAVSEDAIKEYFKSQGIEYTSTEDLKRKLNEKNNTPKPEPTAEEKAKAHKEREQRVLARYMEQPNAKIEDFVALNNIIKADPVQFGIELARHELAEDKFSKEEIENILKEQFFQYSDDEIEELEDDEDKASYKRKREYGAKVLANRSSLLKKQAEDNLKVLYDSIDAEDSEQQREKQFSSTVDEHLATLPRKITFELGKVNEKDVDPIDYEVTEADVQLVADTLKNPEKRKEKFFNKDGDLNLPVVSELLLRNQILTSALKRAYLEGGNKQVAIAGTVFGTNAHELGIGQHAHSNAQTQNSQQANPQAGKFVSKGKREVVSRPSQK